MSSDPAQDDFFWFLVCEQDPDLDACDDVRSFYEYRLDIAANAAFLAIFSLSLLGFVATFALTRRTVAFNVAMICGVLLEILGYAGRVWSWTNQWSQDPFLMQICSLTIGPAFMAAAVYLCLRRVVVAFGPENSRIKPEYYTRIFIPCDVVSLVLQALGGALASTASQNNEDVSLGSNIMVAGLAFQAVTVLSFMATSIDFALRVRRRYAALGAEALDQSPELVKMRSTWLFRGFLAAISVATFCILWRSVFRVAELSEGWDGPIMKQQGLFIGFEGVLIVVACVVLNIFHPAFCARVLFEGGGGLGGCWCCGGRRKKEVVSSDEEGKAEAESD